METDYMTSDYALYLSIKELHGEIEVLEHKDDGSVESKELIAHLNCRARSLEQAREDLKIVNTFKSAFKNLMDI